MALYQIWGNKIGYNEVLTWKSIWMDLPFKMPDFLSMSLAFRMRTFPVIYNAVSERVYPMVHLSQIESGSPSPYQCDWFLHPDDLGRMEGRNGDVPYPVGRPFSLARQRSLWGGCKEGNQWHLRKESPLVRSHLKSISYFLLLTSMPSWVIGLIDEEPWGDLLIGLSESETRSRWLVGKERGRRRGTVRRINRPWGVRPSVRRE